jgi:hypothetical protein
LPKNKSTFVAPDEKAEFPGFHLLMQSADPRELVNEAIRAGDWHFLESYLRTPYPIDGSLRNYLADVLSGAARSQNRVPTLATPARLLDIATDIIWVMRFRPRTTKTWAEAWAMAGFRVSRATVQRAMRQYGAKADRLVRERVEGAIRLGANRAECERVLEDWDKIKINKRSP